MKIRLFVCLICSLCFLGEVKAQSPALSYHPVTPCRVIDTRVDVLLGFPHANQPYLVPLATQPTRCGLPNDLTGVVAYSINITVVPRTSTLSFLAAFPAGTPMPNTSTLNDPLGIVMSNHAVVQALQSQSRAITFFATDDTDLIIDVDGYYN